MWWVTAQQRKASAQPRKGDDLEQSTRAPNWHVQDKNVCRHTQPFHVACTPPWICKWNFAWSRRSARPSAGYEYNFFFLHSPPVSLSDTPPDTKENQLSVCVSDYREVVHSSFTQAPLPQGHWQTLHVEGWLRVQKLSKSRQQRNLTKAGASVWFPKPIWADLSYWLAEIVTFFFYQVNDHEQFVASASSGGTIDWMSNCHPALAFACAASVLNKFTTTVWALAPLVMQLFTEREIAGFFFFLFFCWCSFSATPEGCVYMWVFLWTLCVLPVVANHSSVNQI